MEYKGWKNFCFSDEEMAQFYGNPKDLIEKNELYENEFILISNHSNEVVDEFCYQNGFFNQVKFHTINNSFSGQIKPRNAQQRCAMNMLYDDTSTIKLITGGWGCGKTLLLVIAALDRVMKGDFDKIVWVRNNIQVKDTDQLGALPGLI